MAKSTPAKTKSTPKDSKAATPADKQLIGENTTFTVSIPWKKVEEAQLQVIQKSQGSAKLEGFRKGKAPAKLVEQTLGNDKLRDLTLESILPEMYRQGLLDNNLLPLTDPDVKLESIEPNQDWSVTFIIATAPEIKLDGYEKVVQTTKSKHEAWKPKKAEKTDDKADQAEQAAQAEKAVEEQRNSQINALIEALLENIQIVIPELLLRTETRRRLQDLAKQLEQLNLSVEDYLTRTNRTIEQLQQEVGAQSLLSLQVELLLGAIVRQAKLTVEHESIHQALPHDREATQAEHDYVESVLLKQRAVDHLLAL